MLIVIIIIAIAIVIMLTLLLNNNAQNYLYEKYEKVLTKPETILYERLVKAYHQEQYTISYQVALNRLVKPKTSNQKKRFELLKKIGAKSIDFVVTDRYLTPLFLIELDDSSHNSKSAKERDMLKNKILESADLKLYRFHVKNIPSVQELQTLALHFKQNKNNNS